uniref:Ig-like domain-containing protein n=1 Tax=Xiphophorus maculatus TaxID=8083 RepID=A0A3B5QV46_XIPMA
MFISFNFDDLKWQQMKIQNSVCHKIRILSKAGAVVTLPCKFAGAKAVVLAEWSRPDQTLAPVLLYRNKKVDDNQLAAYKGRTSLLAAEKGDLSLVLKKVVGRDTGKYECRVLLEGSGDEEEELEIEQPRSGEQTNIKATAGEDVTLPCSDPDNNPIQVIEWSRPGLGAKFVLLFKDGKTDVNKQHPSFKDRVELLDSEMTGGDVSLVLKKVQANDTGLFECRVIQTAHGEELRRKVYLDVIGEPSFMAAGCLVTPDHPRCQCCGSRLLLCKHQGNGWQ